MNILRVISSANPIGGGPIEAIKQMQTPLAALGGACEILCLDPAGAPWLSELDMPVHALGPGVTKYGYVKELIPWIKQKRHRYDAIVVDGIWDYTLIATWMALRGTGQPYFVYVHGMLDPWFKRSYPLKHAKKCVFWYAGIASALRNANAVLFACDEERLLARQSFPRSRWTEAIASYPTAGPSGDPEAQRSAFLGRYPQLAGRRLLLFLSRIHRKKGCDLLIEAFAAAARADPALHLVMAGPDQSGWQAGLARRAAALGVGGRVTWTGMLEGDLKWGAFHAAEAFVLPSHQENFGIAVTEALACGLPVLISDKVNIWREIVADRAGLVERDTLEGALQLLTQWLSFTPREVQTMRDNARRCFKRRFGIQPSAHALKNILSGAIIEIPDLSRQREGGYAFYQNAP